MPHLRRYLASKAAYATGARYVRLRLAMRLLASRKGQLPFMLLADRAGVTSLEYGIVAGVLGLLLIAIFHGFGAHLTALFSTIGKSI